MTVAGPFARTYRVRFDEAGPDGMLRPSGYLRFAQDVAWQHSEAEGYDRAWYEARQRHWLVRSVTLRLLAPAAYGSRIEVTTEVTGWRRVLARRRTRFVADDSAGDLCAEAVTDWALLGPTSRPVSVPKAIVERFAPGASFAPLRVSLPPAPPDAAVVADRVRDADVDPMGHLNNAAYLDLIDAALKGTADGWAVPIDGRTYQVAYLRPASAGSELSIVTWALDQDRVACLIDSEGVHLCRALVGL
jgi:acyl-CoA thioesterase FadM